MAVDLVQFWRQSSAEVAAVMERLFAAGDHTWALFEGHLCLERILKAYYSRVKVARPSPNGADQGGAIVDRQQALALARQYVEAVNIAHWRVLEAYLFGSQAKGTAFAEEFKRTGIRIA